MITILHRRRDARRDRETRRLDDFYRRMRL